MRLLGWRWGGEESVFGVWIWFKRYPDWSDGGFGAASRLHELGLGRR